MQLRAAALVGLVLLSGSTALLWSADDALDGAAIAGATGLVLAGALLGLTMLAWRWRNGSTRYSLTMMDGVIENDGEHVARESHRDHGAAEAV